MQNDERVKSAIQKYVTEEAKAGHESEAALMRAQQFLLHYAMTVFSEEDLNRMKQQSLSGNSGHLMQADMLLMNHEGEE